MVEQSPALNQRLADIMMQSSLKLVLHCLVDKKNCLKTIFGSLEVKENSVFQYFGATEGSEFLFKTQTVCFTVLASGFFLVC